MTTHGHQILAGLRELMRGLGRKPSDVESAAWIDNYLNASSLKLKKIRAATTDPRPRSRDAIFDLLAQLDGQTGKITRAGGSKIAGVKSQILEVLPGATIDQVCAEIQERAARYRRIHPQWQFTITSLASHWAALGGGPKTKSAALDIYQEPAGDWRAVLCIVLGIGLDAPARTEAIWLDVSPEWRARVLQDMARNGQS